MQFVAAASLQHPEEFYVNPKVIQLYLDHQKVMANRVNTVNGRMYKNEPAILAWDLINEPRSGCDIGHPNATCEAGETATIQVQLSTQHDRHCHNAVSLYVPQLQPCCSRSS